MCRLHKKYAITYSQRTWCCCLKENFPLKKDIKIDTFLHFDIFLYSWKRSNSNRSQRRRRPLKKLCFVEVRIWRIDPFSECRFESSHHICLNWHMDYAPEVLEKMEFSCKDAVFEQHPCKYLRLIYWILTHRSSKFVKRITF